MEGGVDFLLVETCQDTRNIKAATLAIQRLSKEIGTQIPFIVSVTIEPMGTMLAGQTVEALWASLRHAKPLAFGMNCATGPEFMTDHIRTLSQLTDAYVSCYPNADCRMKKASIWRRRRRWRRNWRNLSITDG